MSLIEQAAKRLEELKRAGIEIPGAGHAEHASVRSGTSGAFDAPVALRNVAGGAGAPVERPTRRSKSVEIDLKGLEGAGYLAPGGARSQLADEFRVIKRPLLANAEGRSATPIVRGNLIMITSSLAGEGKTFVSLNLALSIAMELETRVLLVESDPARPAVMGRLGLAPQKGLLDILSDSQVDLSDVILRTNIEKLSVLPVGTPALNAAELLASPSMQRLLDDLSTRYPDRVVIFDAPPLLPTPETRALALLMGQVVMVVEASRATRATLTQALETIEACPVVMTLLNKTRGTSPGGGYPYYGY